MTVAGPLMPQPVPAPPPEGAARSVDLRVLSWNVRGLRDDTRTLARIVRDLDPDVMCVQEAPKYLRWRSKCAALARDCGLFYVTGGGTTGGSALLASLRVDVRRSAEANPYPSRQVMTWFSAKFHMAAMPAPNRLASA